jgi:hypothetical protein
MMPSFQTIPRLFVSHAGEDHALVEKLVRDLDRAGIGVWTDFQGIELGTPDWEAEVREALRQSFGVLLVASPASRQSPYVRSELLLAEHHQLPLYAAWASGDSWIDSVPLKIAHTQYADLRGRAYEEGLAGLVTSLAKHHASLPSHFLYESYYAKVREGAKPPNNYRRWLFTSQLPDCSVWHKQAPSGYVEICLGDIAETLHRQELAAALFMKPAAYPSLAHLLDDLYVHYLRERYAPFSYGKDWHLRREVAGGALVLMDWREESPEEASAVPQLSAFGFGPGSRWEVVDGVPSRTVTLAAHDKHLIAAVVESPKGALPLLRKCMTAVEPHELERAGLSHIAVATDLMFIPTQLPARACFIQTSEFTPELRERWFPRHSSECCP